MKSCANKVVMECTSWRRVSHAKSIRYINYNELVVDPPCAPILMASHGDVTPPFVTRQINSFPAQTAVFVGRRDVARIT